MTTTNNDNSKQRRLPEWLGAFILVALTGTAIWDQITTGSVDRFLASALVTTAAALLGVRLDRWFKN
jgi:hypothetical protein